MRLASIGVVVFACNLSWFGLGCSGAGAQGGNLAMAGVFVATAAAVQVANSVAEENARRNTPVTHASPMVSTQCDNDGQYGCVSVQAAGDPPPSADGASPAPETSEADARDFVLRYLNGVRRLNGVAPLARDGALDAFAQAGSDELAVDHRPGAHLHANADGAGAEVQGPPEGSDGGGVQDRVGEALLRFMNEGPGGADHDAVLGPQWRRLGVGLVNLGGRTFLTIDFAPN